jgi:peptide/nickel transport system permease protein
MARFLLQRAIDGLLSCWAVVTFVFVITRLLGDPAILLLPVGATTEQINTLRTSLGLDQPILLQYFHFLWNVVHGDFGESLVLFRPALDVVLERMPATILLAVVATVIGMTLGAIAGALAAYFRGTVIELIVMFAALLGQATPAFWLGIMLVLVFAVDLGWLPTGGYGGVAYIVLPAITMAAFTSASTARLLRTSMIEVLQEDYVRTARARGLRAATIFSWYVARNSLIPILTMTGILVGEMLGGSVVIETVFSWPGVGRLIFQAIESKDFPVLQAAVTLTAVVFILVNLAVDICYGLLDPRIRPTMHGRRA